MANPVPEDICNKRLDCLLKAGHISQEQHDTFMHLEPLIDSGIKAENVGWRQAFYLLNGQYMRLLGKVLEGLVAIKEPYSEEKYRAYKMELGTMGPGVFATPWEMSLAFLDRTIGETSGIIDFYR